MELCHISKLSFYNFTFCLVMLFTMQLTCHAVRYILPAIVRWCRDQSLDNSLFNNLNCLSSIILKIEVIYLFQSWVIFVIFFPVFLSCCRNVSGGSCTSSVGAKSCSSKAMFLTFQCFIYPFSQHSTRHTLRHEFSVISVFISESLLWNSSSWPLWALYSQVCQFAFAWLRFLWLDCDHPASSNSWMSSFINHHLPSNQRSVNFWKIFYHS